MAVQKYIFSTLSYAQVDIIEYAMLLIQYKFVTKTFLGPRTVLEQMDTISVGNPGRTTL